MASNYTEHYQLPIWNPDDAFLREEFNESHQKIDTALAAKAKIVTGSYIGTGDFGVKNPCEIRLEFKPLLVFITGDEESGNYSALLIPETLGVGWSARSSSNMLTESATTDLGGFRCYTTFESDSVSWYHPLSANAQLNLSGKSYHYIVIGM